MREAAMIISRQSQLAVTLILGALTASIAHADDPRNPPPFKDTLQSVLDRIHKHAASDDWKKEGFQDDAIEKWLDKLVGSIAAAAGRPDVKLPVRLADVKPGDMKLAREWQGVLIVAHDLDMPKLFVTNSIVLADGNVNLLSAFRSVVVARGAITFHAPSETSVLVAGAAVNLNRFDGQKQNLANGSVIISRGWADLVEANGSMIAAREGITVSRMEGAVFINAPVPQIFASRSREPSKSVRAPELPLESLPVHPLSAKIEVLGVMHAEDNTPAGFIGGSRPTSRLPCGILCPRMK